MLLPGCLLPADPALPLRLQRRKHYDHRVVSGWSLDEATKLVSVHFNDRSLGSPLHHLRDLL